ncbi:hypothetical protein ACIQF5_35655 [Streptomyces goshikiensis]|uniref:hypothetical protein n=1 Tax=Streptomyces goshikiensis TaxID=1942 RepID=UPI003803E79E
MISGCASGQANPGVAQVSGSADARQDLNHALGAPAPKVAARYEIPDMSPYGKVEYWTKGGFPGSTLLMCFEATEKQVQEFLHAIGGDPSQLDSNKFSIHSEYIDLVGWDIRRGEGVKGLYVPVPDEDIKGVGRAVVVDYRKAPQLTVYVEAAAD